MSCLSVFFPSVWEGLLPVIRVHVILTMGFWIQCAVVLCVSCDAALQGLCEDEEAKGGGYCVDGVWVGCCGVYYDPDC